jgi:hypothetical protein
MFLPVAPQTPFFGIKLKAMYAIFDDYGTNILQLLNQMAVIWLDE